MRTMQLIGGELILFGLACMEVGIVLGMVYSWLIRRQGDE